MVVKNQPNRFLFVYGTLRQGCSRDITKLFGESWKFVGHGKAKGKLFLTPMGYPSATFNSDKFDILGEIYEAIPETPNMSKLDAIEGYRETNEENSLFWRRIIPVDKNIDGDRIECMSYEGNPAFLGRYFTEDRQIKDGDFANKVNDQY